MNRWALVIFLLGAVLLAGLFVVMKPAPQAPLLRAEQPARIETFTVENGQLLEGPVSVSVMQDTAVTLRFIANEKDEAHLHGYDLTAKLEPGSIAEMHFLADKSGRFEVELHNTHTTLFALEVQPR